MRDAERSIEARVAFGLFVLDRDERRLVCGDREVELPERSLRALEVLIASAGRTVSKDRLVEEVWAGAHVSDTSLSEAVCRLRTALGDDAREPRFVRTVHGRGYQFISPLRSARDVEVAAVRRRRMWQAAAVGAVLLSIAGWGAQATQKRGRGVLDSARLTLEGVRGWRDGGRDAASTPGPAAARYRLAEVDTRGARVTPYDIPPLPLGDLSVDPAGRRLALSVRDGGESDVWLVEPDSGELKRIATGGFFSDPVWSPDGQAVALARREGGDFDLVLRRVDESGGTQRLLEAPFDQFPESWSDDGRSLVYTERHPETGFDLWLLRREPDGVWAPAPLIRSEGDEAFAAVSPGGRYVAYTTAVHRRPEVFLLDLDGGGLPVRVSERGGAYPFWSAAGDRLHYVRGEEIWTVATSELGGSPRVTTRVSTTVGGLYLAVAAAVPDRIVVAILDRAAISTPVSGAL